MARPKTAGERNEQLMMDKVKRIKEIRKSHGIFFSGEEAVGEDQGPCGEAPVLLPVQRSQWYPWAWEVRHMFLVLVIFN